MAKKKRKQRHKRRRRQSGRPGGTTISVCMIAKDEAGFLGRCLEGVAGLADEVVVADTGSSDRTQEVARAAGARVIEAPWEGDFARARNAALAEARGTWILVLDCDEVLARRDWDAVRRTVSRGRALGYRMTTRNYTRQSNRVGWRACDGTYAEEKNYPGWFPTTKVRLFRNDPNIRFEGAVHELVEGRIEAIGGTIGNCPVPVHHYGYVEKDRPVAAYADGAARKADGDPKNPEAFYELALARRDAGDMPGAREAAERCIALIEENPQRQGHYLRRDFVLMVYGQILGELGDWEAEEAAYCRALKENPDSSHALNNLGTLAQRRGDFETALDYYEQALALAPEAEAIRENIERVKKQQAANLRTAKEDYRGGVAPAAQGRGEEECRLSACLIVRNEERVLSRCLESLRPVADELIVVDTGSTDRSVEIARDCGARVYRFEWCDDFAAARNESLQHATGAWILWMDADNYLLPEDQQRVRQARMLERNQALYFTLIDEGEGCTRFRQVRMFPNRPEIRFERPVHETVVPALHRLGMPITITDVEVRHAGDAEPAVVARKKAYYLSLLQKWFEQRPGDYDTCFLLGYSHYMEKEYGRAKTYLNTILEAGQEAVEPALLFCRAATFYGRCLLEEGDGRAAVPYLEQARDLMPDDVLVHLSLGQAHAELGDYRQAVTHLERALAGDMAPNLPMDIQQMTCSIHRLLGQAYRALGHGPKAEKAFRMAQELMSDQEKATQTSGPPRAVQGRASGNGGRLSLCMIVKNEEARLGGCLDSVQGLADEIVVVDTGSSDRTVAVAERYGAKVGHFEWCDDFAAARNVSLSLATGDWVLWLDADDVLPGESHAKIRKAMREGLGKRVAYYFVLDSRGYERSSCFQMRLFPNLPGVEFSMPIHEQVTPSLARLGVRCEVTDIRVVHTGYTTPEVVAKKQKRYLDIMERWLETHPGDYIVRSHAAMTCYIWGELDRAIGHYEKILYESDCRVDRNLVIETTALLYLGRCYMRKGDDRTALPFLLDARKLDDQYAVTHVTLGECYTKMGAHAEALEALERAHTYEDQVTFAANDPEALKYSIRFFRGQNLEALGRLDEAADWYRRASDASPVRSGALGALSSVCRKLGRRDEAVQALEEALARDPDDPRHRFNRGTFYLEAGDLNEAERWLKSALEVDAEMPQAYLNLGSVARRRGDLKAAEEMYRKAAALQTESYEPLANLGHLLLDQGRYAEAGEVLARVRDMQSGLLDVNLGLCAVHAAGGRALQARDLACEAVRAVYGTALQVNLPQEVPPGALAQVLAECGYMLLTKRIVVCARLAFLAAHLLNPDSMEIALQLAEVYRATGEAWKAVAVYERLIQKHPSVPALFQKLGDCYRAMGAHGSARMCSEHVAVLTCER